MFWKSASGWLESKFFQALPTKGERGFFLALNITLDVINDNRYASLV